MDRLQSGFTRFTYHHYSFAHLQQAHNLTILDKFMYKLCTTNQTLQQYLLQVGTIPTHSFLAHLPFSPRCRGGITSLYQYLNTISLPDKTLLMGQWEAEMGLGFSTQDWLDMLSNLYKCTHPITVRETAIKLHTRWYMAPFRIQSIYPTVPATCLLSCEEQCLFTHILWSCKNCAHCGNKLPLEQPIFQIYKSI